MYRKIALTSVTINVALVFAWLVVFMPWCLDRFKEGKVEMPAPVMLLINISHFLTNPQTIVPTLMLLLLSFFGAKALRKRTPRRTV